MPQNPGLSQSVQQAIQRRQEPQPALSQVSPQAAMANPVPQPATPSSLNQASAPPAEQGPEMPKFEPQNRKDLITLALIEQLKNDNKLDKEKMKMATQPQPEPAQASVAPPAAPKPATPQGGGNSSLSPGFGQPMARMNMQDGGIGDYSGMNNYGR